ncbi:lantibiotic dehydratase C-terminal domain-containing protein [Virgisporangium aurantiacum]|nr:lantibiotic dehydratase C-terminal domain-containing protein [Virgisporangium aurantiacum]
MTDHRWIGVHLFHNDDLDVVLRGPVKSLAASDAVRRWFFLRYWEGGRHIRFRMLVADASAGAVRAEVARRARSFFKTVRSSSVLSADEYRRTATVLAGQERLDSFLTRQLPVDTAQFIAYRPEHDKYGTGEPLALVEHHFAESSAIALALIDKRATRQRRQAAFVVLLAAAWLFGGAPNPAAPAMDGLDAAYVQRHAELRRLVEKARTAVEGRGHDALLDRWLRSLAPLRDRHPAADRGLLDNCAHLLANRLGIDLVSEAGLRYLTSRAVADQRPIEETRT